MFTGIVQATARIAATKESKRIKRVRVGIPRGWKLPLGASVSIDGICSTVAGKGKNYVEFEYMPETLSKTTAAAFTRGALVNLERSLKLGDALDGHFVVGHVDARAKVASVTKRGNSTDVSISLPRQLLKFAAPQGSITINGVALTIARVTRVRATVALIPFTLAHTNLGLLKKGDAVNVEVDLLARYVAMLAKK